MGRNQKRTGSISPGKLLLAFCTCGLSLPFAGIRKRYPQRVNDSYSKHPVVRNSTQKQKHNSASVSPSGCIGCAVSALIWLGLTTLCFMVFIICTDGNGNLFWQFILIGVPIIGTLLIILYLNSNRYKKLEKPQMEHRTITEETGDDTYILIESVHAIYRYNSASVSFLEKNLGIGYKKAHDIIRLLESCGIIGPSFDGNPRNILVPEETALAVIDEFLTKIKSGNISKEPELTPMQKVDAMDGHEFEHFTAGLLEKLGYANVEVTKGSGDQGVDVLAEKDGIRYAIQCKNYSHALGNTPVQEVAAGKDFYNCHVGVVITNNYFTQGGKALAARVRVLLWDRDKLQAMIEQAQQ